MITEVTNRKERHPDETIDIIKNILKENGIKVRVVNCEKIDSNVYSVRVELSDFDGIGANGKGVTKKLALASAYAELMERMQTGFLLKSTYMNKTEYSPHKHGEYVMQSEVFLDNYSWMLNKAFREYDESCKKHILSVIRANKDYRRVSKFIRFTDFQEIDLPVRVINMLTQSNGLCAGNSFEEAVVQGLCEVMERFSYRMIVWKKIKMPYISIDNSQVQSYLKPLQNMGLQCKLMDCSLGGRFPVVGLLVLTEDHKRYRFTVGADPVFSIALQRCVTEMLQGFNQKTFIYSLKSVDNKYECKEKVYGWDYLRLNWLKCYISNSGEHPVEIFEGEKCVTVSELPFLITSHIPATNIECLDYLLSLCKDAGYEVFFKNYSILGFDTYRVYVPGMSEVDFISFSELERVKSDLEIKDIYYNIYNKKNLGKFCTRIKSMMKNIRYSELVSPAHFFHTNNMIDIPYFKMDYFDLYILAVLLDRNYSEACRSLENRMSEENISENEKRYYKTLISKLKLNNYTGKSPRNDFMDLFLFDTQNYLKRLKAPSCPDCTSCICRRKCNKKYAKWLKYQTILAEASIKL